MLYCNRQTNLIKMNYTELQWKQCHITDVIDNRISPHTGPIIYRWWFHKEDSKVMNVLCEHSGDVLFENIDKNLPEHVGVASGTYYALYLGKGVNGRRRLKNHLSPRKRTSTLRRTIAALLNTNDEDDITAALLTCYYEWCELDCNKEDLERIEKGLIKDGYYPLNLKDNPNISKQWKEVIQNKRSALTCH